MSEKTKYRVVIRQVDQVYRYHIIIEEKTPEADGWKNYHNSHYESVVTKCDWFWWAKILARYELRKVRKKNSNKVDKKKEKIIGG